MNSLSSGFLLETHLNELFEEHTAEGDEAEQCGAGASSGPGLRTLPTLEDHEFGPADAAA